MDQWEPSGGEDWETAEDKILAESPSAPEGELWKPSPNQDPLSGPIGTWEPPEEERQWEEDMENNKMSVGEKVQTWQHSGVLGGIPLDQIDNDMGPSMAVPLSMPDAAHLPEEAAALVDAEASHLVENIQIGEDVDNRLKENEDNVKEKRHLEPLIIPARDSQPTSVTSPLSAGSLKTPTDLHQDWSVSPVGLPSQGLHTVEEGTNVYQFDMK